MSNMPACSQCDKEAVSKCEGCAKPFCSKECQIKSQCCIGSTVRWPGNIKDSWLTNRLMSEADFMMLWRHGVNDGPLMALMKTATGPRFFTFKMSTQPNTITAIFAGGVMDRLTVHASPDPEWTSSIKSTNNPNLIWRTLDAVRQYYYENENREFEVKIQDISQVVAV